MSFPVPTNETERLAAVRTLNILDTAPEIAYDEIGELAAEVCQCPVAYISLMNDDRLWLKAKYGFTDAQKRPYRGNTQSREYRPPLSAGAPLIRARKLQWWSSRPPNSSSFSPSRIPS